MAGDYLLAWGVLTAGAYLNQFAIVLTDGPKWMVGLGYGVMIIVGSCCSMIFTEREKRRGSARPAGTRLYATLFVCSGAMVTIFAAGASVSPLIPPDAIFIVAALMFGVCFLTTGLLSEERWLTATGLLWMIASIAGFAVLGTRAAPLYFTFVWILLMAGPGFILSRRRRRALVSAFYDADPETPAADGL